MYKWFRDCKTAEEGKALYHELVKKHHSDNGGNDSVMTEDPITGEVISPSYFMVYE